MNLESRRARRAVAAFGIAWNGAILPVVCSSQAHPSWRRPGYLLVGCVGRRQHDRSVEWEGRSLRPSGMADRRLPHRPRTDRFSGCSSVVPDSLPTPGTVADRLRGGPDPSGGAGSACCGRPSGLPPLATEYRDTGQRVTSREEPEQCPAGQYARPRPCADDPLLRAKGQLSQRVSSRFHHLSSSRSSRLSMTALPRSSHVVSVRRADGFTCKVPDRLRGRSDAAGTSHRDAAGLRLSSPGR
jgi:hypothetical protein